MPLFDTFPSLQRARTRLFLHELMEVIIIIVWLLISTTAGKTTLISSSYSLCISNVPCKCRRDIENRLIVDCSKMNLTEIPRMPNDTVFLSLSNNEILVVGNGTFSNLPHLLSLDLSTNSMRKIDRDAFHGLENLRRLDFNRNNVPLTVQGFGQGVFRSLKNLCYLSIQNVNVKTDNASYPHQIFADIISLTTLKIDGMPNAIFGPGFLELHNLRMLKLSSEKCNIESLFNNTFVYLPFLTDLDISSCSIHRIEPGALIPLRHLQYLDISNNAALGFDGLRNASFGLINGSITILKANRLYPTFHLSVQLNSKHVEFLNQTNIKEMYLDENQIELVESDWGNVCPKSMEKLSVAGNKFTFGLYIFQGYNCKSLKILNGGYQHPTRMPFSITSEAQYVQKHIEECPFIANLESYNYDANGAKCTNNNMEHIWDLLSYCNISSNHYLNSMPPAKQSTSLPQFYGKDENINNTNASDIKTDFSGKVFPIIVPPTMEEFHFQFADLRYEIPEINFRNSSLTFINVSGNSFYKLVGPLVGLEKLKTLDISDNLCSYVSDRFLENVNKLESLFLVNNLLGLTLAKDSDGKILGKLTNLRTLVLSNNQITSLPFQIFSGLHSLEYLDISRNYLQTFNIRMDHMNISHLNVRRNILSSLPANIRNQLTAQANIKNVTVDLTDNPFKCDCSTLEFIKWVYDEKSRVTFIGFDSYTCNVNDNEQSFTNLDNLILGLEKKCANYTVAIWILSISFVLFVVVLTAGVIYRYRWKLRYMYYVTKRRYRGYNGLYESDRENYQFDAFLSYADNNMRFVKFTLLPKVETEGLHLCIHHRDFLPGEEIAANIANAIHRSRKTVVLLDDDFLSSYWCMYELNMARMESVYSRKGENILILLLKEGIDKSKLPLELLDLIHKNTYIELPEDLVHVNMSDICSRLRETIID
uniref:Toll4 n=1 Tax=Sinohyriopsis cumingii TaxID=165450 RepID=A0A2R3ZQC2_SINCU|nr:Toll4 [Sinohyriopsis cumingii]